MDSANGASEISRRTFLAQVIGACSTFLGVLLGIPAVGAVVGPALKREQTEWLPLGSPDVFQEGVPKAVNLTVVRRDGWIESTQVRGVWVVRHSGNQFTAYNGRCTHLGCAYSWQADQHQFACPCHAGVFGVDGKVLAGPPPRPLDALQTRVEGGDLQVQYEDFRLGTPDRPISTVIGTLSVLVVAFLTWRSLLTTPPTLADERAARLTSTEVVGRQLVQAQSCNSCHVIAGQGASVGPNLDGIAARRTAAYIHSYIETPKSLNPSAAMPAFLPPLTHEQVEDITQYLLTLR